MVILKEPPLRSATDAVGGSISLPTARQQPPGAPSARRTTSRPTTDALSRNARWARATRVHTGRSSARIAGAHGARADACAGKREARLSARGWR